MKQEFRLFADVDWILHRGIVNVHHDLVGVYKGKVIEDKEQLTRLALLHWNDGTSRSWDGTVSQRYSVLLYKLLHFYYQGPENDFEKEKLKDFLRFIISSYDPEIISEDALFQGKKRREVILKLMAGEEMKEIREKFLAKLEMLEKVSKDMKGQKNRLADAIVGFTLPPL